MGFDLKKIDNDQNLQIKASKDFISSIFTFKKKLSDRQKELLYSELNVFLRAHVSLKDALSSMSNEFSKDFLRLTIKDISNQLTEGKRFFEVMRELEGITTYEFAIIKIGEETGFLTEVITYMSDYYQKRNENKKKFLAALMYPIMIIVTSIIVLLFMLYTVVPMFEDVFKQNNVELPLLTKTVLALSSFIKSFGFYFLISILLIVFLEQKFQKMYSYKKRKDIFLTKIPFLGSFLKSSYLAQYFQVFTLLLMARLNMVTALKLASDMINFSPLKSSLLQIENDIIEGDSLFIAFEKAPFFEKRIISFIKAGEASNQLHFIFNNLCDYYQNEVTIKSKNLIVFLEPALILVVGVLVALILIAMYLPMFKLSSVLG